MPRNVLPARERKALKARIRGLVVQQLRSDKKNKEGIIATYVDLAELTGVQVKSARRWGEADEVNSAVPDLAQLVSLTNALEDRGTPVSLDWLLGSAVPRDPRARIALADYLRERVHAAVEQHGGAWGAVRREHVVVDGVAVVEELIASHVEYFVNEITRLADRAAMQRALRESTAVNEELLPVAKHHLDAPRFRALTISVEKMAASALTVGGIKRSEPKRGRSVRLTSGGFSALSDAFAVGTGREPRNALRLAKRARANTAKLARKKRTN